MKEMWYIYKVNFYLAVKKQEMMTFAERWKWGNLDLEEQILHFVLKCDIEHLMFTSMCYGVQLYVIKWRT